MFFVRVINNEVKEVWDTQPPADQSGWREAIEVRPAIIPHRQIYTTHSFDITKNPVEIIWSVEDISSQDRKESLIQSAKRKFREIVEAEIRKQTDEYPETQYDPAVVDAARIEFEACVALINAATTHDELDAIK